jgi:hypothetical protein
MTRLLTPALLAALACAALPESANAQWSRQHGMTCRAVSVPEQQWYEIHDRGITNVDDDHLMNVACPSFDIDTHPDSGVVRVRVYVYDGSTTYGVTARVCRTYRTSLGAHCGPAVGSGASFTGDAVLTLEGADLGEWGETSFGYIHIVLPPNGFVPGPWGGGGLSYVKGWVTD